ncbi:hypothetical protein [Pseudomonas xantholysinigenes]|uniref:Uncharacterized protein n=1 Tax=Pseudomonas xantholysinigenes TaxID=2745490 RepID=A0A9E6TV71_9PSED|nr:hypothetical protein [Pseudomonas xantholysinigenes]QXI36983.1 hypothetical protein HU772_016705 [Pseudomonas xantholysinigenes]
MEHVDDLTRQKIREWQLRRLEIKDQMASHPDRVLELSQVLDQMEEEHERILEQATATPSMNTSTAALELQLQVSAKNARDLRKLLELALHELDDALAEPATGNQSADMSGTLGAYRFDLLATPGES